MNPDHEQLEKEDSVMKAPYEDFQEQQNFSFDYEAAFNQSFNTTSENDNLINASENDAHEKNSEQSNQEMNIETTGSPAEKSTTPQEVQEELSVEKEHHLQPPGRPENHLQPPGRPEHHLQRPGGPEHHLQPPGRPVQLLHPADNVLHPTDGKMITFHLSRKPLKLRLFLVESFTKQYFVNASCAVLIKSPKGINFDSHGWCDSHGGHGNSKGITTMRCKGAATCNLKKKKWTCTGCCNGNRFCCKYFSESDLQVCVYLGQHSHPIVTEIYTDLDAHEPESDNDKSKQVSDEDERSDIERSNQETYDDNSKHESDDMSGTEEELDVDGSSKDLFDDESTKETFDDESTKGPIDEDTEDDYQSNQEPDACDAGNLGRSSIKKNESMYFV